MAGETSDEEKGTCLYNKNGMWECDQKVVQEVCRRDLMRLAHDTPVAQHMGAKRTLAQLRADFFLPIMFANVSRYINPCQIVDQPNKKPSKSPMISILVLESPFTKLIIDNIDHLPIISSGHQYLLTIPEKAKQSRLGPLMQSLWLPLC